MIPKNVIEELKDIAEITEVIKTFVPELRRRGNSFFATCPFHSERTPSFSVSPTKKMFKCFGCGETGDVIDFVRKHQGIAFPQAVQIIADRYNFHIDSYEDPNQHDYEVISQWNQDFKNQLKGNGMAMNYLISRGITLSEIRDFEIGFCPYRKPEEAMLVEYDNKDTLRRLGFISSSGYMLFSGRIIFPIKNAKGNVVSFSGRTISDAPGSHKYVNGGYSHLYDKKSILYGLKMARSAASLRDEMNVVEGYTDVFGMKRDGYSNTVATCGTSFTPEQAYLISKVTKNVNFIFDPGKAGHDATMRAIPVAINAGLNPKVTLLNDDRDIYSFINEGGHFKDLRRVSVSNFMTTGIKEEEKRERMMTSIAVISKISNPVMLDFEITELCRNFGTTYRVVHKYVHDLRLQKA